MTPLGGDARTSRLQRRERDMSQDKGGGKFPDKGGGKPMDKGGGKPMPGKPMDKKK